MQNDSVFLKLYASLSYSYTAGPSYWPRPRLNMHLEVKDYEQREMLQEGLFLQDSKGVQTFQYKGRTIYVTHFHGKKKSVLFRNE